MIAGFRRRIEVLAETLIPDSGGGAAREFAVVATPWAAVETISTIGPVIGGRARRLRRLKILIRSRPDLAVGGRIRFEGADYDIVSIESDDDRGRRVFLLCEEAVQ